MNNAHLPGPIRYDYEPGYCGELLAANGTSICSFNDEPTAADAARIVMCWNSHDELAARLKVAVDLLREVVGPLEVTAACVESEDGSEAIEGLISNVKQLVEQFDRAAIAVTKEPQ